MSHTPHNIQKSLKLALSSVAAVVVMLAIVALATGAQKPEAQKATPKADVTPSTPMPTTPAVTSTEPSPADVSAYLEAYGWMVGQQAGFEMGFSSDEVAAIIRGLQKAAAGEKAPANMKDLFPKMQEYLGAKEKAYREKIQAKMAEEAKANIAAGEAYLANIAKQAGVQKTASGVYYNITTVGTGAKPTAEDVVTIHYTGKLIDGTVFDSSLERGQPVDLPLNGVIPGFSEGLQLLAEGGKATLYIPASLGYGNQAAGPIPAGSTLTFEVELIKIQPKETDKTEDTLETLEAELAPDTTVKPASTLAK